jgi:hypothetical protein
MLIIGSIASDFGTLVGLSAGLIAVGGFVGHAPSVLRGAAEERTRRATVIGGLARQRARPLCNAFVCSSR